MIARATGEMWTLLKRNIVAFLILGLLLFLMHSLHSTAVGKNLQLHNEKELECAGEYDYYNCRETANKQKP